jgi:hypothetical protein
MSNALEDLDSLYAAVRPDVKREYAVAGQMLLSSPSRVFGTFCMYGDVSMAARLRQDWRDKRCNGDEENEKTVHRPNVKLSHGSGRRKWSGSNYSTEDRHRIHSAGEPLAAEIGYVSYYRQSGNYALAVALKQEAVSKSNRSVTFAVLRAAQLIQPTPNSVVKRV